MIIKAALLGFGIVLLLLGILAGQPLTPEERMMQMARAWGDIVAYEPEVKGTLRTEGGINTATFLVGTNAHVLSYDILSIELEDGKVIQSQKYSLGEIPKGGAVKFSVEWKASEKSASTNPTAIISRETLWDGGVRATSTIRVDLQRPEG